VFVFALAIPLCSFAMSRTLKGQTAATDAAEKLKRSGKDLEKLF
jgi:hypothetical protein